MPLSRLKPSKLRISTQWNAMQWFAILEEKNHVSYFGVFFFYFKLG